MALTRKDNITPEEHLLRLIEKPAGLEESPSQKDGLTVILGKKKGFSARVVINWMLLFPAAFMGFGKRVSLKTVNRFCFVVITILLGYAIWSAVSAETPAIEEPNIRNPRPDDITEQPDISEYYGEVDKRDIFMDMYKPPATDTVKVVQPIVTGVQPAGAEQKPAIAEVLKNLKLVGIAWEPPYLAKGLVMIEDGGEIRCLSQGETFRTKIEQAGNLKSVNVEVKEIFKDKVTLRYENEEDTLILSSE